MNAPLSRTVAWPPMADITPFELARALGVLIELPTWNVKRGDPAGIIAKLPPEVRRHFKIGGGMIIPTIGASNGQ